MKLILSYCVFFFLLISFHAFICHKRDELVQYDPTFQYKTLVQSKTDIVSSVMELLLLSGLLLIRHILISKYAKGLCIK